MRANKYLILTAFALMAGLAACSAKPAAEASASAAPASEMAATTSMSDMSGMDMDGAAKMGTGVGTITEIDTKAGTLTIQHGAIPAVDWPAMTMAFKATPPSLLTGLKVGQKIGFDVTVKGSDAEVTAVRPQ